MILRREPEQDRTMTAEMIADRRKLRNLEEWVARAVCDIYGTLTRAEVEELERLRKKVGASWCWSTRQWVALPKA